MNSSISTSRKRKANKVPHVTSNRRQSLASTKIVKMMHPGGGFTLVAAPGSKVGDSSVIDGTRYVIRSEFQLRKLIKKKRYADAAKTCTSLITDMHRMFEHEIGFNEDISHWDTGRVKNMASMFHFASKFNRSIGNWNTRNVVYMHGMFDGARSFNCPIGTWKTGNVRDMSGMFADAVAFDQPIGEWNTARVEDMTGMFRDAVLFNQAIGGWKTGNVRGMSHMFAGATKFNQPIGNWNTARVMSMSYMFSRARSFNRDISKWNVGSLMDAMCMFHRATSFRCSLRNWGYRLSKRRDVHELEFDEDMYHRLTGGGILGLLKNRRETYRVDMSVYDRKRLPSLNDARFILGDQLSGGKIRHVFNKTDTDRLVRGASSNGMFEHPKTKKRHHVLNIYRLKDYLTPDERLNYQFLTTYRRS